MPYTKRSRANLLREGIAVERIFVTGNPILEVIESPEASDASDVLERLGRGGPLLPGHHAPPGDRRHPARLAKIVEASTQIGREHGLPVIWSVHPRTSGLVA